MESDAKRFSKLVEKVPLNEKEYAEYHENYMTFKTVAYNNWIEYLRTQFPGIKTAAFKLCVSYAEQNYSYDSECFIEDLDMLLSLASDILEIA